MKPLTWNHKEGEIYDCKQRPPLPNTSSKSIPDESTGADGALVYSAAPLTQCTADGKPVTAAFLAFNQVIGTVQPIAQAQSFRSQQVNSSNEANSHSLNTFGFQTVLQPTWQTIPAPGRKQVTLQNKGRPVSNKAVQPFAQNGIVWMTTIGQMVQTVNNVQGVHSPRRKQSYNPVVGCQNQNVTPSSNMHISIAKTCGSVPQTSVAQGQLNGSDSQGNCSASLNLTTNDFVGRNNQTQIQSHFRKRDLFPDQSKAVSTVAGTIAAPLFHRGRPNLTNHTPISAHAPGAAPARSNSYVWARSSLSSSSQQNGQQSFTNSFTLPNSNGQNGMVLARVTPMSHDWSNLQQIPTSLPSTDQIKVKNLQVESAPLHHTSGNGQQSKTLNTGISAFETLFEKINTANPEPSAARTSAGRYVPIRPTLLPPPLKPSLHEQQSAQNICTPTTLKKHYTVTSPILPSNFKVQQNVIVPWNCVSALNASSKESAAPPLSPLLVRHGNFSVSSTDSVLVSQKIGNVTSLGAGNFCNNGACNSQSVLPAPDVPYTMNMLHSPFILKAKDAGEKSVHVVSSGSNPSVGFNNENPKPLPVQLSVRDGCGKERTADILPVQLSARDGCGKERTADILPVQLSVRDGCGKERTADTLPVQLSARDGCGKERIADTLPVQLSARDGCGKERIADILPVQLSARDDCGKERTADILPVQLSARDDCGKERTADILPDQLSARDDCGKESTADILPDQLSARDDCGKESTADILPVQLSAGDGCGKERTADILPVQLSARDGCGKERTADILPVILPQVTVHNCQTTESNRVHTPPSTLTDEKDLPIQATEGQVHNTAVEPVLGTSKCLALPDANLSGSAGQYCEETSARGASNVDEWCERQKNRASPLPVQAPDCSDKVEATNVVQANVGVEPEIFITGVFSLGDDSELWGSVKASSPDSTVDPINPATGSTNLATDGVNNLSSFNGLVTLESGLDGTVSQVEECNTTVVEENGQIMCKPPSYLESRQEFSATESPGTDHMQPVLESSFHQNVDQLPSDSNDPVDILIDLTEDKDHSTNSALPSDLKEHKTKLDSDKSHLPSEINHQNPLLFDKETQDLDGLLHSVEMEIEAILNFWDPSLPLHSCGNTGMLAYKPNNLQGETYERTLPNTEEPAMNSCVVQVPDKFDKAAPFVNSDFDTDIKVLGHTEILNLLAEISKSNSNERLPAEGTESELIVHSTVRVNEEVQINASENANKESNESSVVVQEMKEHGCVEEQDHLPLQGPDNEQSSAKKEKRKGKKVYCCINAWLVASGVLGIYCNCKLSQRNKSEKLVDLPATLHKTQSNSKTNNQNSTVHQMEVKSSFSRVPFVTHEKVLETAENKNTSPRIVPDDNREKVLGEVPQKIFSVDAIEQSGEVSDKTNEGNKMGSQWKPSITNLNGFCTSEGSDRLTGIVTLQGEPDQNKAGESKSTSLGAVDIGPEKEECIVVLEKELNDYTNKNVRRDPFQNVLNEKASEKTDALHIKQHIDKEGFKVMKRKSDSSNCRSLPKKRRIGVQGS
ncbi:uncharacterized protein [Narcine bancroftii]|uniref:uncharacterized protein isoform X2 n=1 Tax=Narcine bancroftii TaxID=1343680 RepID=UPI0038312C89